MIRIAIVGTGGIANAHANSLKSLKGCKVVAGVDLREDVVTAFCEKHEIPKAFTSLKDLIAWGAFDAAVVATTDAAHVPCALPLVKAGKHVLCEKPIAPTAPEGRKLMVAAEKAGVINMINFSYRNAPVLHHAQKLVASGKLGRIMHLEAHYLQAWLTSQVWGDWRTSSHWLWRLSTAHGSKGALGDIGVHIVDLATYVANERVKKVQATLKTFEKAKGNRIGEYPLDANDSALLQVELEGGGIGTINTTRWATGQTNSLKLSLYGETGALKLDLDQSSDTLDVCLGKDVKTATFKTVSSPKSLKIHQRFLRAIRTGKEDTATFRRGWEVQKVLDAAFKSNETKQSVTLRA